MRYPYLDGHIDAGKACSRLLFMMEISGVKIEIWATGLKVFVVKIIFAVLCKIILLLIEKFFLIILQKLKVIICNSRHYEIFSQLAENPNSNKIDKSRPGSLTAYFNFSFMR